MSFPILNPYARVGDCYIFILYLHKITNSFLTQPNPNTVYGKKQKPTTHEATNLCRLTNWDQYASYKRFKDREVVKVVDGGPWGPNIYTKWTLDELLKEYKELTHHKYLIPVWYRNDVTMEIEFEQEEIPH